MAPATPVVFIHGLWIHSSSWQPWQELFAANGYLPSAPGWPGDSDSVASTRAHSDAVAGIGIDDITSSYREHIRTLPAKPIVIGHSFGGLIAQKLLDSGHAAAAVAIDPGQIKGVKPVPLSQIRSALPVLSRPANKKKAVALTEKQFAYGFGNQLSRTESDALYRRVTIPGPGRVLFEGTSANFTKNSPAAVDVRNNERGPLLLIAGTNDHTVPEVVVRAAHKLYQHSHAVTDLAVLPGKGHSLVFDSGWREVADRTLAWLRSQNL
ncbi:alpha/beta hydrolase [Paractinoplanes hotanensis]|uniref:Alpha/beta hydrolase n=1 Tax=Paractinoplanes hotanensis TaxID=2906497 RepID=A0ABT0YF69_9ACTN|nr:alpha/beta hydrolase [Actinoplanes hotanensis]MCM4084168.1 alpha/beta hydrolase [Actinoplanes hotanensis]